MNQGTATIVKKGFRFAPVLAATILTILLLWMVGKTAEIFLLLFISILISLYLGAVTDFLDLPLWPAFNVADVAITFESGSGSHEKWALPTPSRMPATGSTDTPMAAAKSAEPRRKLRRSSDLPFSVSNMGPMASNFLQYRKNPGGT